jgi:hypothetical protein
MQELYRKGAVIHPDPESYADNGNIVGVALTGGEQRRSAGRKGKKMG